ncbi:MAG: hypothetical protein QM582_10110 [Micropruina sp.]|uniref:hypothetical protein n=1 Tax=Micropruina sp. TaxID=2737536 RepID=UPI0039E25570
MPKKTHDSTTITGKPRAFETQELRAGHLDDAQLARAEALDRARQATKQTGGFGAAAAEPYGLIDVATWILDGQDPLSDEPAGPKTFAETVGDVARDVAQDLADQLGINDDQRATPYVAVVDPERRARMMGADADRG